MNDTRARANQAIEGSVYETPPAQNEARQSSAARAVERYHQLSRNVCRCRGTSRPVVGGPAAWRIRTVLAEHRVEGFPDGPDANQLALVVRGSGVWLGTRVGARRPGASVRFDIRFGHDAAAESH